MGKRIPFDVAMQMESVIPKETDSIFIDPAHPNPYGYRIQVKEQFLQNMIEFWDGQLQMAIQ